MAMFNNCSTYTTMAMALLCWQRSPPRCSISSGALAAPCPQHRLDFHCLAKGTELSCPVSAALGLPCWAQCVLLLQGARDVQCSSCGRDQHPRADTRDTSQWLSWGHITTSEGSSLPSKHTGMVALLIHNQHRYWESRDLWLTRAVPKFLTRHHGLSLPTAPQGWQELWKAPAQTGGMRPG